MPHRTTLRAIVLSLACACLGPVAHAEELFLVAQGKPRARIYAPGENEWAGRRLADRICTWTGVRLDVQTDGEPPPGPQTLIAVGTPQSNPVVRDVVGDDERLAGLGDEGYLLKVAAWGDRIVLTAGGQTLAGVQYAVSELVSWRLVFREGSAALAGDLNAAERPALDYRLVWTWDGNCNWAPTVAQTMALYVNENPAIGSTVVPYTPEGFRTHFTRAIDFLSDHKLNGLIVWGFLRDEHGGLEMGREISGYARRNNVRILPGVCSQGGYGGFIFSQTHEFNLDVWCRKHPELQARNAAGDYAAGMIDPARPENQQWLRDGARWLFTNLPDIGGINLENGDFMSCQCETCRAERAKPENDPNCLWDMATSQRPILEVAQELRPDGWMTFATYVGFTQAAMHHLGDDAVYPPKFLQQIPENAICQWTFSGMTTPSTWPEDARPAPGRARAHVGLLHHGSVWGAPLDPERWWAAPGAWNDEYSPLLPFICGRIAQAQLGGLVITGQNGDQCPAHELNYLALEYFSWSPAATYADFQRERLAFCYGGADRAEQFLALLRGTSREPLDIDAAQRAAEETALAPDLDLRQRARWRNLADELARRGKLAQMQAAEEAAP